MITKHFRCSSMALNNFKVRPAKVRIIQAQNVQQLPLLMQLLYGVTTLRVMFWTRARSERPPAGPEKFRKVAAASTNRPNFAFLQFSQMQFLHIENEVLFAISKNLKLNDRVSNVWNNNGSRINISETLHFFSKLQFHKIYKPDLERC